MLDRDTHPMNPSHEPNPNQPPHDAPAAPPAESFVPLFSAAHPRVYACILTLVPNRTDADEIMQEVSLVLWSKFDQFKPDADPTAAFIRWACGIAYNQARQFIRNRQRDGLCFNDQLLDKITEAREQHTALFEDRRDALRGCLDKLTTTDRELIQHCYGSPASLKQKAQEVGRPVNTVYKALNRIRAALHRCIERALRLGGDA